MPLQKEVPRSDIMTKFMKSSSCREVFELFFVVIFTYDKEIVSFHYILLNLSLKIKYAAKTPLERHGALFFNPSPIVRSIRVCVQLESGAVFFYYLVKILGRIILINEKKKTSNSVNIYCNI